MHPGGTVVPARNTEQALAHLLRCTERMLHCADQGDWAALELLTQERLDCMNDCFGPGLDAGASEMTSDMIAAMLVMNDRLVQRVATARGAVMDEIAGLQNGRGGRESYSEVQGLCD